MSPSVSIRLLLTQSDERLVGYARAGHERAFEALVHRYRRQLHGYCRRLLLSNERAEDALQQALLQAWVALRDGAEVRDVRPWLYRIVHNAAMGALRVSGYDYCTLSESLSGAGAPQDDLDRRIAVREALAGLAALPQMQREALLRTAIEGRSHQQVASDLGLSEPAVRGLVYRARSALRAAAGALMPPPALSWALEAGNRGTPALEGAAGLAGGGSAGLAGLLAKGGAVAATAGALAGGLVVAHGHTARAHPPAHATSARAAKLAGSTASGDSARPADSRGPAAVAGRAAPLGGGVREASGHPYGRRFAPAPAWAPHPHGERGDRQTPRQPTFATPSGAPGGGAHDGHGDGFGVSAPGSGDPQREDGGSAGRDGGGGSTSGSAGPGQDGSGDGGQTSGGESTSSGGGLTSSSGGGGGTTSDGSGETLTRESTSGGSLTSTTSGSKDGADPVEGSFK